MDKEKYYKQALDILAEEHNWKKICAELAKRDPKTFCDIVIKPNEFESAVLKIYTERNRLQATNFVKREKCCSIADAKLFVDTLIATKF